MQIFDKLGFSWNRSVPAGQKQAKERTEPSTGVQLRAINMNYRYPFR